MNLQGYDAPKFRSPGHSQAGGVAETGNPGGSQAGVVGISLNPKVWLYVLDGFTLFSLCHCSPQKIISRFLVSVHQVPWHPWELSVCGILTSRHAGEHSTGKKWVPEKLAGE